MQVKERKEGTDADKKTTSSFLANCKKPYLCNVDVRRKVGHEVSTSLNKILHFYNLHCLLNTKSLIY